jgi:hypothetical protein
LISFLRILTFSVFGILIVNIRSGSSPRIKQLRERSRVESRVTRQQHGLGYPVRVAGTGTSGYGYG